MIVAVSVFWNENLEPNIGGYKIYAALDAAGPYNLPDAVTGQGPKDVGNVLQSIFNVNVVGNMTVFFRFTCYNTLAEQSGFSATVSATFSDQILLRHRKAA